MADSVEEKPLIEDDFHSTDSDIDELLRSRHRPQSSKRLVSRFAGFHVWCLLIQVVLLSVYIVSAIVFAKSWTFYHATSGMGRRLEYPSDDALTSQQRR